MKKISIGCVVIIIALFLIIQPSAAVITPYFNDIAGFNSAAGSPPVAVDFDSIAANTPIPGMTINGITILPLGPALPIVIRAADSFTSPGFSPTGPNVLVSTSGENVLSPGGIELVPGPNPPLENDDMILLFNTPVDAVGFDLIFQSLDGYSYVQISVFDGGNNLLDTYPNIPIPAGPGSPSFGGSSFVGFVSDSNNIARIVIDDQDDNNVFPDSNIGLDTIRAEQTTHHIPEFPTVLLPVTMTIGFLGAMLYIKKTREQ